MLLPLAGLLIGLTVGDQETLQGIWRVTDARARMSNEPAMIIDGMVDVGTVEFSGDTIVMRQLGHGDVMTYRFTLDARAVPRRIRMVDPGAADSGRWVGIYSVSGDTLRLSLPIEHFSDRPIPPPSFNAPNTAAYTLRRDREAEYLRLRRDVVRQYGLRRDYEAQKPIIAELERRFRPVVGSVTLPGFQKPPTYEAGYWCEGEPVCAELDALSFREGESQAIVTTPGLLQAWLADHPSDAPATIDSALRSPEFLARALGGNAAVVRYADLTIPEASRRGIASAMLMLRAQDESRDPPEWVLVTVRRRSKVYVFQVRPAIRIDVLPACAAPLDSTIQALMADNPTTKADEFDRAWSKYRGCYQTQLSQIPGIDKIIGQVTTLVDSLPP